MPLISAPQLTEFVHRVLTAAGVPPHKATVVAESVVASNLRAVDTHGIQLIPFYVEKLLAGEIDAATDGRVVSENGACMTFDGQNGIGQWVAQTCCDHAIRLAGQHGMGIVIARESNHFGACAWWSSKMSKAGQIGIVMCNASPIVPPWQGREGRMGTNPICVALPGPWLLDMATTTVAAGKIFKAMINGQPEIPAGWAFNSQGVPTTSTAEAYHGGMLMPLGGYKGSGLAMLVEILCGALGGGAMSREVGGIRDLGRPMRTGQTYISIDIARFMPVEEFTARVQTLVGLMKGTAPASGYDEVMVAGDPEWRAEAERLRNGIPLAQGNWDTLCKTALKLGVTPPDLSAPALQ